MARTVRAPKSSNRPAATCVCWKRRTARLFAAAVFAALSSGTAHAACSISDIELKDQSWTRDAGWFTITGELKNRCAEPTGVQLELALRDAAGQTVSIEHVWPAKTRNLKPGESWRFKTMTRGYATAKDVAVRIIDVRKWPQN
jgi:hypothetical protein